MRFLSLLVMCFCFLGANAQKKATIQGIVEKEDGITKIWLYKVHEGNKVEVGRYPIGADGRFRIEFEPEYEGFYTLGHPEKNMLIYVKPGDEVNLHIQKRTTITLEGKNTKENEMLYKWLTYAAPYLRQCEFWIEEAQCTYKEFFPQLEKTLKELPAFRKTLKSGNAKFDTLLDRTIDYQIDWWAMRFLWTPRSIHPTDDQCPDFFRTILNERKIDHYLLDLPFGQHALRLYQMLAMRFYTEDMNEIDANEKLLSAIIDERCKEFFVLDYILTPCKSYQQFKTMDGLYGSFLKSEDIIAQKDKLASDLKAQDSGAAPDFTYPDTEGKMVSLSDFKGKVVLIDVWATWCGPCQAQIPHLLKLEKELKDSGIVFIGVSVDEEKNHDKWLDMIKEKGLKGIQLFANGWSKITEDYEIKGIPRFIVVDKNGNLVAKQAPVPSDPALKKMLLETLKK